MTVTEIKKKLKEFYSVSKIVVSVDEYEEGFDVHVNVWYCDKWLNPDFEDFHVGEFDTESKAVKRAKDVASKLPKATWNISNC